jgi:Tol biopolymer transport system component
MKEITHKQAGRFMLADLDGLLTDLQRRDLQAHLDSCPACRAESESFSALTPRLQRGFHSRLDAHDGPSENVLANVRSQTWRITMTKRIDFAFNIFGGIVTFLVLGFVVISIIAQFTEKPTPANETQTDIPAPAPGPEERLIAFVSNVGLGNRDIFTMKADGSELTNITNNPATDDSPAWSPDGTQIAFVSDRSGGRDIYVMNVDGSNVRKLTDSSTFNDHFTWSPDGTKIAYLASEVSLFTASQLMVMNSNGSNKIALTHETGQYDILGWSPDGQNVVYKVANVGNNRERVMVVSADGTNTLDGPFFEGDSGRRYYQIHWESPELFITLSMNSDRPAWGMWTLSRFYTVENQTNYIYDNPVLVASEFPIVAIFERTYVVENQDSLNWLVYSGAPIPLTPWNFSDICKTPIQPLMEETTHTISPNGQQDFVALNCPEGITHFFLMNADGTEIHPLGEALPNSLTLMAPYIAWSPDEKYVIVTIANRNKQDLYLFDIQEMLKDPSAKPVQLTTDGVLKYGAVWQPVINPVADNEVVEEKPTPETEKTSSAEGLIAFTSAIENGNLDIYTMRPDGSGLTNLTNNPAHDVNPFWSPDGKRIAFESDRTGFMQIFLMDVDGKNVVQLTDGEADHRFESSDPWSPDGSKLLFVERAPSEEKWMLYTIGVDGQNKTSLTPTPNLYNTLSWSPDGSHIAFVIVEPVGDRDMARIYAVDTNGDSLTNVTNLLPADEDLVSGNYSWSVDGQSIFFVAGQYAWENTSGRFVVYEASLDGNKLTEITVYSSRIEDWWGGTAFIQGFDWTTPTLTWLRSDGTTSTLKPFENCQSTGTLKSTYKRLSNGILTYGAQCPNDDVWLYWANADGTEIKQLLSYPIPAVDGSLVDISWSPADRYAALNVSASSITSLYLLDVESGSLLTTVPIGGGVTNISWQPMP